MKNLLTKQYLILFKEWIKYKLGNYKSLSLVIDKSEDEATNKIIKNLRKLVFLAEYWWYKKFVRVIINRKSSAYILILLERLNPSRSSELKLTEDTKELKTMIETFLGITIDRKETGLYYQGRGGYWSLGGDQDVKDHLSLLKILLREAIYRLGF